PAVAVGVAEAQPRAEILERLGVASLLARNYADAVRYFREAIAAGRDHAQVRQSLGFALAALDRCGEAVDELETSIRQRPAARTYLYLARCYERLKKPGVAIYALQQGLMRVSELTSSEQKDAYARRGPSAGRRRGAAAGHRTGACCASLLRARSRVSRAGSAGTGGRAVRARASARSRPYRLRDRPRLRVQGRRAPAGRRARI